MLQKLKAGEKIQQQKNQDIHQGNIRGRDSWLTNGGIHLRKALIFTDKRRFNLRLNSKTGEVTYYKEIKI